MCRAWWNAATPSRSCPMCCCRRDGATLKLTATDLDIEIVESVPAEVAKAGATTVPAHMLYDIVRKLPDGAQLELDQSGDSNRMADLRGPLALHSAGPAAGRLSRIFPPATSPTASAIPAGDAEGPHREDPFRDLHRGNPLLSERHLFSRSRRAATCCVRWRPMATAWPRPRSHGPRGPRACPA